MPASQENVKENILKKYQINTISFVIIIFLP